MAATNTTTETPDVRKNSPRRPRRNLPTAVALVTFATLGASTFSASHSAASARPTASAHTIAAVVHAKTSKVEPHNVAPAPNFIGSCTSSSISISCVTEEVAAINHARQSEGVAPMVINLAGFAALTPVQQLFAVTNLERTARGLAPVTALTAQLDSVALAGATSSSDPSLSGWTLRGGGAVTAWGSNWAGSLDVLGADYVWMYDDGVGYNVDCPAASSPGCWGHRNNVLFSNATASSCTLNGGQPELVMGAAVLPTGYRGTVGIGQIIVDACGGAPSGTTFTWRAAKHIIFAAGASS